MKKIENQNDSVSFESAYQKLNAKQKEAVDEVYGPVMVIAGPGTGKTQLLAVRVCNIIQQAAVGPQNILCLTYTDAGVRAMRERLTQFMGADAYKVGIFTFHSFCLSIIKDNSQFFSNFRELNQATDLDLLEIIISIIDDLPLDHGLKRLTGDLYYDRKRISNLINLMKREQWTPEFVCQKIDEYILEMHEDPNFISKQGPTKGQLKKKSLEIIESFKETKLATLLVEKYNTKLRELGLIDFQDMINMVINELKANTNLLARYQEQYQFILADEYQDTNGSQNDLLFTLANNELDDAPNVFVVGDDDQAIFSFQGANMANISHFRELFKPKVIILEDNYRSYQGILDGARKVIENNKGRLTNIDHSYVKILKESRTNNFGQGSEPHFIKTETTPAQHTWVIEKIESLIEEGVPHNEIAVLYKNHNQVINIAKCMLDKEIPIRLKKEMDVLEDNLVEQIVNLMKYIIGEHQRPYTKSTQLFQLLHYPYFAIPPQDLARLSIAASKMSDDIDDDINWRVAISDADYLEKVNIKVSKDKLLKISAVLENLIANAFYFTPQTFFEKLLLDTGIYQFMLTSPDATNQVAAVNTLFEFIKEVSTQNFKISLSEIIKKLDDMVVANIKMPLTNICGNSQGVNLMTFHASKGLEFQYVFMIDLTEKVWEKKRNGQNQFKMPPNLYESDASEDLDELRRLFFVALTRAKDHVYLCYPATLANGDSTSPSMFLAELFENLEVPFISVKDEKIIDYTLRILKYKQGSVEILDKHLIDRIVEKLQMNATGLSKYLKCPLTFYFENILRAPSARTASMGLGNAVHYALDEFVLYMERDIDRKMPTDTFLLEKFRHGMRKFRSHFNDVEYENGLSHGEKMLARYYTEKLVKLNAPRSIKTEYVIKTMIDGIPVSGIIDRIDIYDDRYEIFDYKTGRRDTSDLTKSLGEKFGKYWIQAIFYQILLDNDPSNAWHKPKHVQYDYLMVKDRIWSDKLEPTSKDKEELKVLLKEVYAKIKNYEFPGCKKEDCKWCEFVEHHTISKESNINDELEDYEIDVEEFEESVFEED